MFPIKDQNPTRTFPFVNYLLMAANVAAYVWETLLIQQNGEAAVVSGYGLVATRLLTDPAGELFTVFTSMFMHGGLAHLGGNLLFLWIFGDNVEDAIGHLRYIGFYSLCGVCAALAQVLTNTGSQAPMVGASGAIAGVLGAYLVLYPRAPITVFAGFFLISVPAWVVVGFWFLLQLSGGWAALGLETGSGVAFFA